MDFENSTAVLAIRQRGAKIASSIADKLSAELYAKSGIQTEKAVYFDDLKQIFAELFENYKFIVAVMAQGIVVRMISNLPKSKYEDPAVVVVDEGGRYAISMLSGHEGGANRLSYRVCSIIGCEPVVTTATEATKNYIVGVGCRKGIKKEQVVKAIETAAKSCKIDIENIRAVASCWYKEDEKGLIEAVEDMGLNICFLPKFLYDNELYNFSESAASKYLGIKNVAEASALLLAKNPSLIMKKSVFDGVTVAIAKERLLDI
jgi:cobalt-precorrin 5A hydrolase